MSWPLLAGPVLYPITQSSLDHLRRGPPVDAAVDIATYRGDMLYPVHQATVTALWPDLGNCGTALQYAWDADGHRHEMRY